MRTRTESVAPYLLVGLAFAGIFFWMLRPVRSNDIWWHLETGRRISATRQIPRQDIYSWTRRGAEWINLEWLYDVGLYQLFAKTGWGGIICLKSILVAFILACLGWRCRQAGAGPGLGMIAVVWGFYMAWPGWAERADLISVAGVALLLLFLNAPDERLTRGSWDVWVWPLIFCAWANLHGGFVLGLAIFGLWMIGRLWDRRPVPLWMYGVLSASTLVTLCNPYGIKAHVFILRVTGLAQRSPATEWAMPPLTHMALFWITCALTMILALSTPRKSHSTSTRLILLITGLAALRHARYVPFFTLTALPFLVSAWVSRMNPSSKQGGYRLAIFLLFLWCAKGAQSIQGGVSHGIYPQRVFDYLQQKKLSGPFYNDWELGSYWIWRFRGEPGVFIDGRSSSVAGYMSLREEALAAKANGPVAWHHFLERYGVRGVLIRPPTPSVTAEWRTAYFPPETWLLRYSDDLALVFTRRDR